MFVIQVLDHDEGTSALWHDMKEYKFISRDEARKTVSRFRKEDEDREYLYSYRIVEEGSDLYYSQPTDRLEY